jgi:hypothetical protein
MARASQHRGVCGQQLVQDQKGAFLAWTYFQAIEVYKNSLRYFLFDGKTKNKWPFQIAKIRSRDS